MTKETLMMLARLYSTTEGEDFLKFLKELSKKNYEAWKQSPRDLNDVCKGKALAIDDLITCFTSAISKLDKYGMQPKEWL